MSDPALIRETGPAVHDAQRAGWLEYGDERWRTWISPIPPPAWDALDAAFAALKAAAYVQAPRAGCADPDDRNCDEYSTPDSKDTGIQWCSHVVHRHATFADVHARERLEAMVLDIRRMAASDTLPPAAEMVEDIDGWLESLRHAINDITPGGVSGYSVADIKAATADLDAATQRWHEREGAEFTRVLAERAFNAEQAAIRLRVELRQARAEIDALRTKAVADA